MKKYINAAFAYAAAAMAGGVFYREFAKGFHFTETTALGKVHTHLFLLGMVVFLLVALFARQFPLTEQRSFRVFWPLYHVGVSLTAVMLFVRGVVQVLELSPARGMDAAISGMAGLGHILTGAGIVLLFVALRKAVTEEQKTVK